MKYYKNIKKLSGTDLIQQPLLNKGTAFNEKERTKYKLHGLLPCNIENINEQLSRVHASFQKLDDPMAKHIYLRALQDRNETVFYRYLLEHPTETMPIIYTPTVGLACQEFSKIYRHPRGIYLSYPEREHIPAILKNIKKNRNIKITVITDGERILGLGDQGVGGLGIPIGKLSLYCLLGGIHPAHTLPIILDVGTNNPERLAAKDYLGWRHERLTGQAYLDFVEECIQHIVKIFPEILVQFEDFAQQNAHQLLNIYQDKICCFNDDIQGTAAVAGATVLSAIKKSKLPLEQLKIAIYGAGSAGCGIASLIKNVMKSMNVSQEQLNHMFYMIDRNGLIHDGMGDLLPFQKPFVQSQDNLKNIFELGNPISLEQVIDKIQPQVLIGVSGQFGHFTQEIVTKMASYAQHPIIMPLSNPNEKCEANPSDIINWTKGQAIIATGSPFPQPVYQGVTYQIAQCNNAYIFPAMGLGVVAGKLKRVPEGLFEVAAKTLAEHCPMQGEISDSILPPLTAIREIGKDIAQAMIEQSIVDGQCRLKKNTKAIQKAINSEIWYPDY
jgi:malate dehydrogenase (oxaloacetate-decarboxylating)